MVGTENWNRKIAQKNYGSLEGNLEKLFGRGGELSKRTMVSLGNGFWEGEMVFAKDVDMLETQRS
jgi:hypothetical protein